MRLRVWVSMFAVLVLAGGLMGASSAPAANPAPLRILVTNDDGIGAPGIAAVVDALQALPNVTVIVIAPATNQSGTGITYSTGPVTVAPGMTANGDAGTAVSGTPADSVFYAVQAAGADPDVVVSGSNFGQNIGNLAEVSGTVGAGRTANRLGLPAIAVSQGFATTMNYTQGANLAAFFVEALRPYYADGTAGATTININVPTCPTGSTRGNLFIKLGRTQEVSGYALQSGSVGNGTFQPTLVNQNPLAAPNCLSTLRNVTNDIQAFLNGFVTITWLMPDLTAPGHPATAATAAMQKRLSAIVK